MPRPGLPLRHIIHLRRSAQYRRLLQITIFYVFTCNFDLRLYRDVMVLKSASTYASANIARGFAQAMNATPTVREVRLVGRQAVKALLDDIRKGGKTSSKAKVVFR